VSKIGGELGAGIREFRAGIVYKDEKTTEDESENVAS
jgi:hypothetical protein